MIEQLQALLTASGGTRMTLALVDEGNGNVSVTVTTEGFNNDKADPQVRAALATPLHVRGFVGEVDAFMGEHISRYATDFSEAATVYSNSIQASAASKRAATPKSQESAATSKTKDDAFTVKDAQESAGSSTETGAAGNPVTDNMDLFSTRDSL